MEKKKPNVKLYIGLFIAFIMVTSIFGFIESSRTENKASFEYNGFDFFQSEQGLYTKIDDKKVFFYYLPQQVEHLEMPPEALRLILNSKVVALTYDPSSEHKKVLGGIQYELIPVFEDVLGIIIQRGLVDNKDYKLDKVTCEDATEFIPVIYFKKDAEEIVLEKNCVIINSEDAAGFIKMYNRLLYGLFGVIK